MAGLLAACGREPPGPAAKGAAAEAVEAGYMTPPAVLSSQADGTGVVLQGRAPAGARVRLATPQGSAVQAAADAQGRWNLRLPPSAQARIFGLSAQAGARPVQGEGYVVVTPGGEAVLLRAGAGALKVGARGGARFTTFDFDRDGGAVASGLAPPGEVVSVRVDGRQTAEARADAGGRFTVSFNQPLADGAHQLQAFVGADEFAATVDATSAAPLSAGPFRATAVASGLRVDWMTPGGGVQSTVIFP